MYGECDSWIPVFLSLHRAAVRKFPGSVLYEWKSEKMKTYWSKPDVKE